MSTSSSRTAVAEQAGAKSQLTGLVGAAVVIAMLVLFPAALADLPQAALAGVVIVAALSLADLAALRRYARMRRSALLVSLVATAGVIFLGVQAYEYSHAYAELNLKLTTGAYGSTFFMLTGFHGFHVLVGMLMLLFITLRLMKGHFTSQRHFGFEGAAWYWHFVDVVWLGLYTLVYWL